MRCMWCAPCITAAGSKRLHRSTHCHQCCTSVFMTPGKASARSRKSAASAQVKNDQHNYSQEFFPHPRQCLSIHPAFSLNQLPPRYSPSITSAQTPIENHLLVQPSPKSMAYKMNPTDQLYCELVTLLVPTSAQNSKPVKSHPSRTGSSSKPPSRGLSSETSKPSVRCHQISAGECSCQVSSSTQLQQIPPALAIILHGPLTRLLLSRYTQGP